MFSHVLACSRMFSHVLACSRMFSHVLACSRMFSHVLACSRMFSHVLACSRMFSHVLACSRMFSHVLACSRMFSHVLACSRMFSHSDIGSSGGVTRNTRTIASSESCLGGLFKCILICNANIDLRFKKSNIDDVRVFIVVLIAATRFRAALLERLFPHIDLFSATRKATRTFTVKHHATFWTHPC